MIDSGDGLMEPQFPIQISTRANQMAMAHVFKQILEIISNGTMLVAKLCKVTYVSYLSVLRAQKLQS